MSETKEVTHAGELVESAARVRSKAAEQRRQVFRLAEGLLGRQGADATQPSTEPSAEAGGEGLHWTLRQLLHEADSDLNDSIQVLEHLCQGWVLPHAEAIEPAPLPMPTAKARR